MFYELLKDGSIGRATENKKIAEQLGLNEETHEEIVTIENGKRYLKSSLPAKSPISYKKMRLKSYPSVGDQLDMIFWDYVNGTNNWQNAIKSVKEKYPKN